MNPNEFIKQKAQEWFDKAENDLRAAEIILSDMDPPTDTACYHCQQAIEKYLKGLLTLNQIDFIKTHDLDYLFKLSNKTIDLNDNKDDILSLNKYAIEARYPADEPIHYPVNEAIESLDKAKKIINRIKASL